MPPTLARSSPFLGQPLPLSRKSSTPSTQVATDFALPDHDGAFSLPVPPGEYAVKVFFDGKQVGKAIEGLKIGERPIEIKEPIAVGGESK